MIQRKGLAVFFHERAHIFRNIQRIQILFDLHCAGFFGFGKKPAAERQVLVHFLKIFQFLCDRVPLFFKQGDSPISLATSPIVYDMVFLPGP